MLYQFAGYWNRNLSLISELPWKVLNVNVLNSPLTPAFSNCFLVNIKYPDMAVIVNNKTMMILTEFDNATDFNISPYNMAGGNIGNDDNTIGATTKSGSTSSSSTTTSTILTG